MKRKISDFLPVILLAGALATLIIAIIPLVKVAKYTHPCADDYTYGFLTHEAWTTTHSITKTIGQALSQVKETYNTWQGTHSSIFLMALSPAVFEGDISYGMSAWIMIGILLISVFCILHAFFVRFIGIGVAKSAFVSAITCFWMLESIYSPVNGLFWFNGSVHYWFMHGCMLLSISNIVCFFAERRKKNRTAVKLLNIALSSFFAFMCGGANYSTALLTGCILALLVLCGIVFLKVYLQIAPFVLYLASFAISILAPGNSKRGSNFAGKGPLESIVEAFKLALYDATHWVDLQTVIIVLMLLPVLFTMSKKLDLKGRLWLPVISIIISFGLHASMYVPLFFAMGGGGIERQENICKLWFELMVVINLFLIISAVRPFIEKHVDCLAKRADSKSGLRALVISLSFYIVLVGGLLLHMKLSDRSIFQYSSYIAYVELKNGEAKEYYSTYEKRLEQISEGNPDVVLEDYSVKPYLLYFDDITSDVYDWKNAAYARWYGLNSVRK